ncbi:MAG TPA: glycogen/starch/alpha-glucan phosphorylase [Candidatus Paceibacterota bacterium]|nr:glycogen/starch/alpha-glucan phosphorylase [Verrucomicrobiota bacterium]HRY49449.1 glycogen/starch/alpha-glucan phosphorylase [Candidatus Paceibacterota bacterium]HRZ99798.1 glycogen/starch/alpha-glucan phosphorylase [Candidatus Paceibacterota bacterium]
MPCGLTAADLRQSFLEHLLCGLGRVPIAATRNDVYTALAMAVRDRVLKRGVQSLEKYGEQNVRAVAYLSAEFLPGPHLANNLLNLGILDQARQVMSELGWDLDDVLNQEEEPGLGNGGLGRLASCYMDSLATIQVPAVGYGIRYEFGIFDQILKDGWQVEITDKWLRFGNPWEIARPEINYEVNFGGRTESCTDDQGRYRVRWIPDTVVKGVAYDTPILGYRVDTCNILRLWKAEAVESFDFAAFNHGDYYRAVEDKMNSENITKVLYPNDEVIQGKILRLQQQYFFVTCSLQDMLRVHRLLRRPLGTFHEKWAVQLNDTHPAIAVAELMRLLVDRHLMDWDTAWNVTRNTFGYTNHTLLPEALEKWPLGLFGRLLPRHLEIIYEINARFLDQVRAKFPGDDGRLARMSLIDETGERYVRMANLATVGSHHVNGVAQLHSDLLRQTVMHDFAELWPEKFCNVTNGVTPRRFVAVSNPSLTQLISSRIGEDWLRDLDQLKKLEPLADDAEFQKQWRGVKLNAKRNLAALIEQRTRIPVNPESMFDIQAKRLHEYKRQHLNVLHILTLYLRLKRDPQADVPARVFIFGAKAAPGYFMAKLIIKLINSVAELVNQDPIVQDRLKIVFFPDYNVKNAQHVYPAADLSEQISTAGKEASGTGNMKFALNGALTIGTLDGANVEIREEVGPENFFLFGLTADQVHELKSRGYQPFQFYERNANLREALDFIVSGALANGDTQLFRPLVDNLLWHDPFLVLADYQAYVQCQESVSALWRDPSAWTRMAILNVARMGKFSSDRSIRDYCRQVWNVNPLGSDGGTHP